MRPAIAYIHIPNLLHNYHLLCQRSGDATVMAVVKANAYGHGLNIVAQALQQAGCTHFAVTDANEGKELRQYLGDSAHITLLSGIFDSSDAQLCAHECLTPVVTQETHLQWLNQASFQGEVWIKVDTGMQRLGASDPQALIDVCQSADIEVMGIMSHLACADTPEHPLNHVQALAFEQLHQNIAPKLKASLLNSAGIVAMPQHHHDMVRPGIALYGAEPIADEPLGLKPVMQLSAQVMQVRHISQGATLSYGATYTAEKDMQIALICAGYADGLPRGLSNTGHAEYHGEKLAIVGRVCMDYCLLDCSDTPLQVGDCVRFWGDGILVNDVANQLNTIAYTLMTGVGSRVQRIAITA
jgi:alanine racemase